MSSTTKGIITVVTVLAVGYAAYYFLLWDKKAFYAKKIVAAGKHGSESDLKTLGEGYLKEWYKSVKKGSDSFTFEGKTYNTQGGRLK